MNAICFIPMIAVMAVVKYRTALRVSREKRVWRDFSSALHDLSYSPRSIAAGGVPFYLSDACRSSAACDFSERQRIDELRFYVLRFRFRRGGCCCFDAEKPPHYSSCDDGLDRRLGHVYCFCGSPCSGDCDFTVALCSGSRRLTDLCACGGK